MKISRLVWVVVLVSMLIWPLAPGVAFETTMSTTYWIDAQGSWISLADGPVSQSAATRMPIYLVHQDYAHNVSDLAATVVRNGGAFFVIGETPGVGWLKTIAGDAIETVHSENDQLAAYGVVKPHDGTLIIEEYITTKDVDPEEIILTLAWLL